MRNIIIAVGTTLILLAIFSSSVHAELANNTPPSGIVGIFGTTSARYCSTNADCGLDYICFLEHDGISNGTNTGSCYPKWETFCVNNGTFTANSGTVCRNSSVVLTCSSGTWSASSCATLYSCKAATNTCTADAAGSDTTGTSGGNDDDDNASSTPTSSLDITSSPADFVITQNTTDSKSVVVHNNGQTNLTTLTLALSGLDVATITITPPSFSTIRTSESKTFVIVFEIPETAAVGTYTVTVRAAAGSVSDSVTFRVSVAPSNATIENVIVPQYENYTALLTQWESRLAALQSQGKNTTELERLIAQFRGKINETSEKIAAGDYLAANGLLGESEALIAVINDAFAALGGGGDDLNVLMFAAAVIVVVAVVGVVLYKFLPRRRNYHEPFRSDEKPQETGDKVSEILQNIRKKERERKK